MSRRLLAPAILLLLLGAACATSSATGGAPSPSGTAPPPKTDLTVIIQPGFIANPTPKTFRIACDPPSGTVPDPARACAALPAAANLFAPHTPCVAPDTGTEEIVGTYRGQQVDIRLAGCDADATIWQGIVRVLGIPT
jgi:hypothetical protein